MTTDTVPVKKDIDLYQEVVYGENVSDIKSGEVETPLSICFLSSTEGLQISPESYDSRKILSRDRPLVSRKEVFVILYFVSLGRQLVLPKEKKKIFFSKKSFIFRKCD